MSKFYVPFRLGNKLVHIGLVLSALVLLQLGATAAAPSLLPGGNPALRMFGELRAAAEKGDVIAQRLVADAYLTGEGVKQDLAEGVRWVRLAA